MTRYIGYKRIPETEKPERFVYNPFDGTVTQMKEGEKAKGGRTGAIYHVFREGEWMYYLRPSGLNTNWEKHAVDRYRSFGVKAGPDGVETVMREVMP
jgi:hypothetical protein